MKKNKIEDKLDPNMKVFFIKSMDCYQAYIKEHGKPPTPTTWNKIAKIKGCLSSRSLQYVGKVRFSKEK